jgi:CDGSH-type Zn-finger protein
MSASEAPNGPLFLRGQLRIVDGTGVVREATRVALCRCGGSGNKPFCDGTHREIGFRTDDA